VANPEPFVQKENRNRQNAALNRGPPDRRHLVRFDEATPLSARFHLRPPLRGGGLREMAIGP
jgi:hypothetical protein